MIRVCLTLFCFLGLSATAPAQDHSSAPPPHANSAAHPAPSANKPAADYSHEPFIIEQYITTARFENDGTSERTLSVRARVQTEAGVHELSAVVFGYDSPNEQVDVRSLKVHKEDGSVVTAATDAVKDATAPIANDAPAFANRMEKHLSIPALAVGDTLEYEVTARLVKPFAENEFWFQHDFLSSAVVLDERLEISVPETRKVNLASLALPPYETTHAQGRTIYRWKHANLIVASDDDEKKDSARMNAKPPDVQLTTFATWDAVARWYANLEKGRSDPTPEISAKTKELIEGRATDLEKMQALYEYVSKNIRYVSLSFGTGNYQPHSAGEVFTNKYGDSKDKHTLLASMLQAAGIPAEPALIPSARKVDVAVPSPAQFDHMITAVPRGTDFIWLDSSAEITPFRLLASPLRNKSVLVVTPGGVGRIAKTPADPPFLSTQYVDITGQVSDLGKLTASAHYAMRGDTELVLRLAFFRTPQAQWKDLGQTILSLDGIHGEVTSAKSSDPTDTRNPFQLDIDFTQSNFMDWSSKRQKAPLPLLAIGVPDPPEDAAKPITIGSPLDVKVTLKLALPPAFSAQPPIAVSVTRDYAEFKSSYRFGDGAVTAERSLDFKLRELPASRLDDYQAFARAVSADQLQALTIIDPAPSVPASATPDDLFAAGLAALNAGNASAAAPLLERAVQLDPQHKQAWNVLGLADLRLEKFDEAASAFQKHLAINPEDEHANEYLGIAFDRQQKYPEAIAAFRKQIDINPLDASAHAALGEVYLEQHDYAQAAPELDKATILSPGSVELQINLGRAYLNANEKEKGLAAFQKAAALSSNPLVLNDIAYNLADAKVDLDKAQEYGESALSAIAADLNKIDLLHLTTAQLARVTNIAATWDTVGWIYFQKGDFKNAERYIRAAWLLDQEGEVGDHLAQVYDKLGQKDRALRAYALALAAPNAIPETRARFTLLLGGNSQIDDLIAKARPELAALRVISAGKLFAEDAQADFFVLLAPGEKAAHVDAVRFVSGSEKLRPLTERLRSLDYGAVFPDATPAKIVRRGTLACSATTGDCNFTLASPEDLKSPN